MGTEYWAPLCDFLRETLAARGMVGPGDLDLLTVTDSLDEAAAAIQQGVAALPASWLPPKRRRLLLEG
jgi:predicted Rossmann-fold nucleotide-binding protein